MLDENRNRIAEGIRKLEAHVSALTPDKIQKLDELTRLDSDLDLFSMQNLQAQSFASGLLNEDEARTLYIILGGELPTAERFNSRSPAERYVAIATIEKLGR